MMKRLITLSVVTLLLAVPRVAVVAQEGPPPRGAMLRRELEQRFAAQMREQLQLSGDQETRVRGIMSGYAEKRRGLENDEREMRQALNGQLRPGIAANPDSVTRLVDGISAARVNYAKLIQDEMRELSTVLDPVQRGQLFLMRDRVLQRVREMRDAARARGGQGGQGRAPPE
ncbi:MAG TPA: Spy/CpxP family protein refolding chaperone [Gemmatimonadales bacterium]|nr:Spy/CpxP family protein refolding chaperone [Gemmatimonadales bacterium]